MQNNKIVYFDYWTVGIKNFKFFDNELRQQGKTTKLIHLNSWRGIEGAPHQQLQGIECYDISYYNTNLIYKVLEQEKPAAVIILNASFITDRSVILSCKKLGIKTIYLAHGSLTREEFIDNTIESLNVSMRKNRLQRAIKHFKGTVVNYLYSLSKFHRKYIFLPYGYLVVLRTFVNPAKYLFFPPHSFDLEPDLTLVYGKAERDFFKKRFPEEKWSTIKVTGMPDLDRYFKELDSLGDGREDFLKSLGIPTDRPFVTYIEEGLMQDNIWDADYARSFFSEIAELAQKAGFHLVIKLHPKTASGPQRAIFDGLPDVTVLDNVHFSKLIYFTDKCISHFSSTFIYPILLGKPILVPQWERSGDLLRWFSEKEVTYIATKDEMLDALKRSDFQYDRTEYLDKFVPYTDGQTDRRIGKFILDILN